MVVTEDGKIIKEIGGYESETTNNRMELTAVIEALKIVNSEEPIQIVTDSEYVKKGITEWIDTWKNKDWKTAAKKPVKNQSLWKTLDRLNHPNVKWKWTRGHSGDQLNEYCDWLAKQNIKKGEIEST